MNFTLRAEKKTQNKKSKKKQLSRVTDAWLSWYTSGNVRWSIEIHFFWFNPRVHRSIKYRRVTNIIFRKFLEFIKHLVGYIPSSDSGNVQHSDGTWASKRTIKCLQVWDSPSRKRAIESKSALLSIYCFKVSEKNPLNPVKINQPKLRHLLRRRIFVVTRFFTEN